MTTSASQRLALTQVVEEYSEELVDLAEAVFSPQVMEQLNSLRNVTFMAQLNNLAGVARETESPAVVRNWIQYQMGRRETSRAWAGSGFGNAVLTGLSKIKEMAGLVATDPRPRRRVEIGMLRRYAGYLVRWYVAKGGQQ